MKTTTVKTKSIQKYSFAFLFLCFSLFQSSSFARVEAVLGNLSLAKNPNLATPIPTTSNPEILLSREQYVISYNKERRSPNWAAWQVEASELGSSGRSKGFEADTELDQYLIKNNEERAPRPSEYQGSCFDRGHQVPSADRTVASADNESTFLMSNMVPQTPYLNRGLWKRLEAYTRDLVVNQGKKVYVFAGPIYDENFGAIGPKEDIPVPSKNFKVLVVLDQKQTLKDLDSKAEIISVVMPNTLADGSPPPVGEGGKNCERFGDIHDGNSNDWQKYKTSLADVERLANLNLIFK